MGSLVKILVVGLVALVGYVFPKKYNNYFHKKYRKDAVSMPLTVATALLAVLWLVFMDVEGFWYWFLLIGAMGFFAISVVSSLLIGIRVGANGVEVAVAVLAQIMAIAGIVVQIVVLLALVMEVFGGKKKKR